MFLTDKHIIIIVFWLIRSAFNFFMYIYYTLHGVKIRQIGFKINTFLYRKVEGNFDELCSGIVNLLIAGNILN